MAKDPHRNTCSDYFYGKDGPARQKLKELGLQDPIPIDSQDDVSRELNRREEKVFWLQDNPEEPDSIYRS